MEPQFQTDDWEQDGPSYAQSYICSFFIVAGLIVIVSGGVPFNPLAVFFFAIWFGAFIYWFTQNRHGERTFASNRITIVNGRLTHTFRYAVTEADHLSIDLSEIIEMRVHSGESIAIEMKSESNEIFFVLSSLEQLARFEAAVKQSNPNIDIVR